MESINFCRRGGVFFADAKHHCEDQPLRGRSGSFGVIRDSRVGRATRWTCADANQHGRMNMRRRVEVRPEALDACEGDEPVVAAGIAVDPREPRLENAAREIGADLAPDEAGDARPAIRSRPHPCPFPRSRRPASFRPWTGSRPVAKSPDLPDPGASRPGTWYFPAAARPSDGLDAESEAEKLRERGSIEHRDEGGRGHGRGPDRPPALPLRAP